MSTEMDELASRVADLEVAVADAVNEIKSLAEQLAANAHDSETVKKLTADIKAQTETLHSAVFPPSAAHE